MAKDKEPPPWTPEQEERVKFLRNAAYLEGLARTNDDDAALIRSLEKEAKRLMKEVVRRSLIRFGVRVEHLEDAVEIIAGICKYSTPLEVDRCIAGWLQQNSRYAKKRLG